MEIKIWLAKKLENNKQQFSFIRNLRVVGRLEDDDGAKKRMI